MKRVMIIGCSASGKSTLSRKLSERTGLPVIHLDQEYFSPNWVEMEKAAWRDRVGGLAQRAHWIMDGNYSGTFDLRLPRADTIIFVDRSRWLCLWRATRRILKYYGRQRPDSAPGCQERFSWPFFQYIFFYNTTRRPKILQQLAKLEASKTIYRLRSDREVRVFLTQFS